MSKPIGGLIVVLFVTLFVGVWLYVDGVKNDLEARIDAVAADVAAWKKPPVADAKPAEAPEQATVYAPPAGWFEAVSTEYGYRLWLPPDARFSESGAIAYVTRPTEDNPTPIPEMAIAVRDASEQVSQSDASRVFRSGDKIYHLHLWEGLEWPPFNQVVESFQTK